MIKATKLLNYFPAFEMSGFKKLTANVCDLEPRLAMNPALAYWVDDGSGCRDAITNIPSAPEMSRPSTPRSSQPAKSPRNLFHIWQFDIIRHLCALAIP